MSNKTAEPRINAYICNNLHITVTIDGDKGVTPMFISCPKCDGMASSRMYDVDTSIMPTHEWYLPNEADIKREAEDFVKNHSNIPYEEIYNAIKEHTDNGGLSLREIKYPKHEKFKNPLNKKP